MLFEHPETGLQVEVERIERKRTYRLDTGESCTVVVRVELRTAAGQEAGPWGDSDFADLLSVGVCTNAGLIQLVRVCDGE